jgi:hypothetical protein
VAPEGDWLEVNYLTVQLGLAPELQVSRRRENLMLWDAMILIEFST